MSQDVPPELQAELLDDFFAECDEHLSLIRQALVSLEASAGKEPPNESAVNGLFRSFHSFKGIAAIVGLTPAEELAHAVEDFLRHLTRGTARLTSKSLELLMEATQRLEQIATAFRDRKPLPSAGQLLANVRALANGSSPRQPATEEAPAPASSNLPVPETARAGERPLWRFTFSPSKDLDARGININSVRARLSEIGEILQAAPSVRGPGQLSFIFVTALAKPPGDFAAWQADGIQAEEVREPAGNPGHRGDEHNPFVAPSQVVRVDLPRLDDLMGIAGEMVIKRSRFEEELNRLSRRGETIDLGALREVHTGFGRSLRELREAIMRVRMVPVGEIFSRMPFVVKDLARNSGKSARVVMTGQQTEIDKFLIEKLKDPLLHLVRNSFSHGVETPADRRNAGKPEEATITLSAAATGDSVVITVSDDGCGIDRVAVANRAAELGLSLPLSASNAALLNILCRAGFSTRNDADRAAGRGVGLEVVQTAVQALGGSLLLESAQGIGTQFVIRVPLTLAIAETIIVSVANLTCAVPQNVIAEVLPLEAAEITRVNGVEVMPYRNGLLPVVRLCDFFRLSNAQPSAMSVLVLHSERGSSGLVVDRIHGQREVVVRTITDPLIQAPGIAGATELGDGKPVLILDSAAFTAGAVRPNDNSIEQPFSAN